MSFSPETTSRDGNYPSRLARNLVAARAAVGLTQHQLARRSRISRATIAHIEATESDPRLSTVVLLARALDVSPLCLLLGEPEIDSLDALSSDASLTKDSKAATVTAAIGNAIRPGYGDKAIAAFAGKSRTSPAAGCC